MPKKEGLVKSHEIRPSVQVHAAQDSTSVSFYQMMINDVKTFLVADPAKINRYVIFDNMPKLDPELGVALEMITFSVLNSYEGPAIKEGYEPKTKGFLETVQSILGEINFSTNLPEIVRGLVENGDVIWRIHKKGEEESMVSSLELLPTYAVTIIDKAFENDPEKNPIIRKKEFYLVGENKSQNTTNSLKAGSTVTGAGNKAVGEAQARIPSEEILHFSMMPKGNFQKDIFGRDTYGIWGISPFESLVFVLKLKLALTLDYLRWSRTGLPRWDAALDLSEVMNIANYQGSQADRLSQAREAANEIFEEFRRKLYYKDDDANSPTYNQDLPIETDHMWIHGTNVTIDQKGGVAAEPKYLEVIKKCNMSISSALGVPLSLFGYESGSTYAIGYITREFMTSIGGGLLKCIESTVEEYIKQVMISRGMSFVNEDFDNLLLKYKVNDTENLKADLEIKKLQITLAGDAYDKGIISKNEARAIIGLDPVEGGDEFKAPAQNPLDMLSMLKGQSKESAFISYLKDSELGHHDCKLHGHDATAISRPNPGLSPMEIGLESSLIRDYNKAVEGFAERAMKVLDGIGKGAIQEEPDKIDDVDDSPRQVKDKKGLT